MAKDTLCKKRTRVGLKAVGSLIEVLGALVVALLTAGLLLYLYIGGPISAFYILTDTTSSKSDKDLGIVLIVIGGLCWIGTIGYGIQALHNWSNDINGEKQKCR